MSTSREPSAQDALVFSGDITDYWSYTLVRDYLLLMPGLPHPALRLYEILRSMIAEANKHRAGQRLRRMTIDQLCWLLTDDLGKPVSVSSMYEILGVLERLELVVPRDTQAAEGSSRLKGKEKAARGILRGFTVRDLPKASYTGWRNAWDKLGAYRADWRESRPEPPTHVTSFEEDADHQRVARVKVSGPGLGVFQDSGTGTDRQTADHDPFQDSGTSFQNPGTAFRDSGTDLALTCENAGLKEGSLRSLSRKDDTSPDARRASTSSRGRGRGGSAASGKDQPRVTAAQREAVRSVLGLLPDGLSQALPSKTPANVSQAILAALAAGAPCERTPVQLVEYRVMPRWNLYWAERVFAGEVKSAVGALLAMLKHRPECGDLSCEDRVNIHTGAPCRSCEVRREDRHAERGGAAPGPAAMPAPVSDRPATLPAQPHPLQNCDGCDRAFRGPAPGLCHGCQVSARVH